VSIVLRFPVYEVEALQELIQSNWGIFPRSSVVNEAIGHFLHTASAMDWEGCKKRKVNLLIAREKLRKLTKCAQYYGVNRADVIRYVIRNVIPMFAKASEGPGYGSEPSILGSEGESKLP
jgi:hypothetical protein